MFLTAKITVSLFLELLPALQSHSKILRSPSDRYFQLFHHPQLSHTHASFSTLACHVQHLLQLGIFRKTAIPGQFRLDWQQSSYRTFQWGYSIDFLRIEGYEHSKLCFWIVCFASNKIHCVYHKKKDLFLEKKLTRKKIHTFDTTPKQFVSLIPNFWCWPMWKAAMFMHHDVDVLEQVLRQKLSNIPI